MSGTFTRNRKLGLVSRYAKESPLRRAAFETLEPRRMLSAVNPMTPIASISGPAAPAINSTYVDGSAFSLSALNQPILVFEFGASWCPWCKLSLPKLQAVSDWATQNNEPADVIAINEQETPATIQSESSELGLTLPVVMDPTGSIFDAYGQLLNDSGIPLICVIAGGKIAWDQPGYSDDLDTEIESRITDLAAEVPTPPPLTVSEGTTGIADGQTSPVDFGTVSAGGTAPHETFTVCNEGSTAMNLGPVSLPDGFAVTQSLPATLSAGQCANFTVALDSSNTGTFTGNVSLLDSVTGGSSGAFDFPITGTVSAPTQVATLPPLTVSAGTASIANGQTTPVSFGSADAGGTAPQETFTVCNEGSTAANLGTVALPSGFVLSHALPATLSAGQCADLTVTLSTSKAGVFNGNVSIPESIAGGSSSTFAFPITGAVTAAPAVTRPTPLTTATPITTPTPVTTLTPAEAAQQQLQSDHAKLLADESASAATAQSDVAAGRATLAADKHAIGLDKSQMRADRTTAPALAAILQQMALDQAKLKTDTVNMQAQAKADRASATALINADRSQLRADQRQLREAEMN